MYFVFYGLRMLKNKNGRIYLEKSLAGLLPDKRFLNLNSDNKAERDFDMEFGIVRQERWNGFTKHLLSFLQEGKEVLGKA